MKTKGIFLVLFGAMLFIQCSFAGYRAPTGSVFTSVTLNKDISSATDLGSKSGEACTHNILYLFSFGHAGIVQAAANGGIKTVKGVDFSNTTFLSVVYSNTCTIARGD